jgi:small GTP-binding protein
MGLCVSKVTPCVKVLFVGDIGCGKTSLINSILFNVFEPVASTEYISITECSINDAHITIVDGPGHNYTLPAKYSFVNDATHIVICVPATAINPFEIIRHYTQELQQLYSYNMPHITIVITKTDLVNTYSGQQFRIDLTNKSYTFLETSAKTGRNTSYFLEKYILKTMPKRLLA